MPTELETLHEGHVTYLAALKTVDALRGQFTQLAQTLVSNADEETATQLIGYVYWEARTIPVAAIAEVFGCRERDIQQRAGIYSLLFLCPKCGGEGERMVGSRSMLTETTRTLRSKRERDRHRVICVACEVRKEAEDEITAQHYRAYYAAQEGRIEELRTMPYREYLQSPEWQERRKRILRAVSYRCQVCNCQGKLNVHHRTYERRGNEYNADLLVLCADCHTIFHREGKLVA